METLAEIERMIASGKMDESKALLDAFVKEYPDNAHAWFLMGGLYRRHQMWGDAINAYNRAKLIDPEGPADAAIESIYDILGFVNKDLMNP